MATPYPSYREALRATMVEIRRDAGRSEREAANTIGVSVPTLQLLESGEYEFSLTRVIRLCRLYGVDPTEVLVNLARTVLGVAAPPDRFDALSLFCNVTPDQWLDDGVLLGEADVPEYDPVAVRAVIRLRHDDPRRRRIALALRRKYESEMSIRALHDDCGVAFGTVRGLLLEAGTELRRRGAQPKRQKKKSV